VLQHLCRCVLYEMVAGNPPYIAVNQVALAEKICNGATPQMPARCPMPLRHIMHAALRKDPARRPTMLQCFQIISSCCFPPAAGPDAGDALPVATAANSSTCAHACARRQEMLRTVLSAVCPRSHPGSAAGQRLNRPRARVAQEAMSAAPAPGSRCVYSAQEGTSAACAARSRCATRLVLTHT
jgi:serine/threonine protein kinase